MEWVNLTASGLARAARETGLAVLPLGSLEAHADHLPLGNDTFKVDRACIDACRREPAVVLPAFYYTEVQAMSATPGAVGIPAPVLTAYAEAVCDEAARNGFGKILLVSGHGGNFAWVQSFLTGLMRKRKPYLVYSWYMSLIGREENRTIMETPFDGHGGEVETSIALHLFPELCHLPGMVTANEAAPAPDLGGAQTPFDWVMRWPRAVSGNPVPSTAQKGRVFYESCVDMLADVIVKVKADTKTAEFKRRFEDAGDAPGWPPSPIN